MQRDWGAIFPGLDDPILGRSSDYDTAEGHAARLELAAATIADEFARIKTAGELGELEGQVADRLVAIVAEVDGALADLHPVFDDLGRVFEHHARELRELERAAEQALARANTRWAAVQAATAEKGAADDALASIDRQLRSLWPGAGDPAVDDEIDRLTNQRWGRAATARARAAELSAAEADLDASRVEYDRLRADEDALVHTTRRDVKGVDLGDLKDPNRLLQLASSAFGWVGTQFTNLVTGVVELTKAVLAGDFMDALWHLSEVLEAALDVLLVVAVVVVVVGVVVFPPALALLPALVTAHKVLTGAKVLTDLALVASQHPHPETGQPKSVIDVAIDIGLIVASAGAARLATRLPVIRTSSLAAVGRSGAFVRTVAQNQRVLAAHGATAAGRGIVNPASGRLVGGTAREMMVARARDELRAVAVDTAIKDTVVEAASGGAGSWIHGLADPADHDAVSIDVTAWEHPGLIEFMEASPLMPTGLRHIDDERRSMRNFQYRGPSLEPTIPQYQLVPAG